MNDTPHSAPQPLQGLRVIEFTHMVMGPACGLVLADLGAEVVRVEPIEGDHTRKITGFGSGFFPTFNRNKTSVGIDLKHPKGRAAARRLCLGADVVIENFKPGTMRAYGLDYAGLHDENPRLIYASHKGFLPGPYEHRTALDEVVQMMGGLAYMTGRPGDPLRAGASVNDIMGGLFGAIAVMAALIQRGISGRGMDIQSGLFENNVFLVGQHMLGFAITGTKPSPVPKRDSPWPVYDLFTVKDGEKIFLAAVSDAQWAKFCDALQLHDLRADPELGTNAHRVAQRARLVPAIAERVAHRSIQELSMLMESAGLPFAHVRRPDELYEDAHLLASGGLGEVRLSDGPRAGSVVGAPLLPITMDGHRLPVRSGLPKLGEHGTQVLAAAGYSTAEIEALRLSGAIR